jgi:hypothetical protein
MPTADELNGILGLKLVEAGGGAGYCGYVDLLSVAGKKITYDISCRNDYADLAGGTAVGGLGLQSSYLSNPTGAKGVTTQLMTKHHDTTGNNACSAGFDSNAPANTKDQEIAVMRLVIGQ